MQRSSLKYLVVGVLVGALVGGGSAAAIVLPAQEVAAGTAAETSPKAKPRTTATRGPGTSKASRTRPAGRKSSGKRPAGRTGSRRKPARRKPAKRRPTPVPTPAAPATGTPLVGLFRLAPGTFAGGRVAGSYVRLVLPGGSVERGPYFPNPNSTATTYTLLAPGSDGGLRTGSYQEAPSPAFSATGDARANRIMAPQRFAFILYSLLTAARDPQSGRAVPPPAISVADGRLSGQVQALTAQWNRQSFNQGSPKPDGSSPGLTSPVTGTYDAQTKAYTFEWTSQIVGGPFNNFSGFWHLEGVFEPTC